MENISWQRQTKDKPAFPDVIWSRPENKRHAGKLLIIGGHAQSFSAPSRAYAAAASAGAGTIRILLPDSLQKTVGKAFLEAEFAPSTPIGSFSRQALDSFIDLAGWADGVLLAGDFGKNSETAIVLDSFIEKYTGQLSLTGDSLDYFLQKPAELTKRHNTLLVGELAQIQKLAQPLVAIKQTADLVQNLNALSRWTSQIAAKAITSTPSQILLADSGKISTTAFNNKISELELAAYASVWWLQQPERAFEALSSAIYEFSKQP